MISFNSFLPISTRGGVNIDVIADSSIPRANIHLPPNLSAKYPPKNKEIELPIKNDDRIAPCVFSDQLKVISASSAIILVVSFGGETILTIAIEKHTRTQNAHNTPIKQSKTKIYRLGSLEVYAKTSEKNFEWT